MLGWISLLGLAGGEEFVPPAAPERRRRAPLRKEWWDQDRFYLPPHKKKPDDEPLPHVTALEAAKADLQHVRQLKAANAVELRRLGGTLGGLTSSARAMERRIEAATAAAEVAQVTRSYRRLGRRLKAYADQLETLREARLQKLREDDNTLLTLIMEID